MSLYNLLFGVNPYASILKHILELDCEGGYSTGRFRDIYLAEGGTKITLYTRNGGGNRECWELDGCVGDKHDGSCMVSIIDDLTKHPNYITDYDDDFDSTYAYFEFSVPEPFLRMTKRMFEAQGEPENITSKFNEIIQEIQHMPKEELEKDRRFKPLLDIFEQIIRKMEEAERRE